MNAEPTVFLGSIGEHGFSVATEIPEVREWLEADYCSQESFPRSALSVLVQLGEPDRGWGLPTPRSRWNPWGESSRVIFFGKVQVTYHFGMRWAVVRGTDPVFLYEALEFLLNAYVGEAADEKGQHRVHGLGVRCNGQGHLFLGGSGAGKTTMAREFLEGAEVEIYSDDTPFVSGDRISAYPHRLSFKEPPPFAVAVTRQHLRPQYGNRFYVSPQVVRNRWAKPARLSSITLLVRTPQSTGVRGNAGPVSSVTVFWWLFKWLVLGLETPQIAELRLRTGPRSLLTGVTVFFSRLKTAYHLAKTVPGYVLHFADGERASERWRESLQIEVKHRVGEIGVLVP